MSDNETSEFGKGLCYCLGLFLAHAEGFRRYKEMHKGMADGPMGAADMWFNGASDHLYDFMPDYAPTTALQERCQEFKNKCFKWRGSCVNDDPDPTEDNVHWALQEAKDLLREIDLHHNIPAVKGSWE